MTTLDAFVLETVEQLVAHGHTLPITFNVTVQHLDGRVEHFSEVIHAHPDKEYPE